MSAYHAEDVCSSKLPDVLDELLKPAPRLLCLFNRGQFRCAGLVLGELGADQVKYRSNSLLELDAVRLPGVSFFDQLLEVLLSVGLRHYDKILKKNEGRRSTPCYGNTNFVVGEAKTNLTSQLPIPGL